VTTLQQNATRSKSFKKSEEKNSAEETLDIHWGYIYLAIDIMLKTFARPTISKELSCTENLQDSEGRSAIHARDLKILCNNKENQCLIN
jgi:hypothetical protein